MSLSIGYFNRGREALQEKEVKLDPMGCWDLKEVLEHQDQMDPRYRLGKKKLFKFTHFL